MMISSIQINGYRGLERLEMSDLGRVNLLVGTNNCGKTSALEAIEILASKGNPLTLWGNLRRRGERITTIFPSPSEAQGERIRTEADVCHLFTGHELRPGETRFSIVAKNQRPERFVSVEVVELPARERTELTERAEEESLPPRLALIITGNPSPPIHRLRITRAGGIIPILPQRRSTRETEDALISQFITTEAVSTAQLLSAWHKISLTPEEDLVVEALRFLDKDIERIAPIPQTPQSYFSQPSRGGFLIKKGSSDQPIPIGSMGDGMWRLLALSISITQCKGGTLLVDEIDTGLHYTVMSAMWKLIFNAAKRFDVQVFATSHSYDCIYSLAQLAEEADPHNPITVQRIERGRSSSVPFSEREIEIAAEREIEIR